VGRAGTIGRTGWGPGNSDLFAHYRHQASHRLIASRMQLSPSDRKKLVARVEGYLAPRRVERAALSAAIDRVAGALTNAGTPLATAATAGIVIVVSATNMPDLGSRLRAALPESLRQAKLEAALEGRHAVVCLEVRAEEADAVREAASRIGANAWTSDAA
jgi:hypothetical protein